MTMWGMESVWNGYGMQEWPEGSKYEGEYRNNLKHGTGVYTWANGEVCFSHATNKNVNYNVFYFIKHILVHF